MALTLSDMNYGGSAADKVFRRSFPSGEFFRPEVFFRENKREIEFGGEWAYNGRDSKFAGVSDRFAQFLRHVYRNTGFELTTS